MLSDTGITLHYIVLKLFKVGLDKTAKLLAGHGVENSNRKTVSS